MSVLETRAFQPDTPEGQQLREVLTDAYQTRDRIVKLMELVGIRKTAVNVERAVVDIWPDVLTTAAAQGKLRDLVKTAAADPYIRDFHDRLNALLATSDTPSAGASGDWIERVKAILSNTPSSRSPVVIAVETETDPLDDTAFSRTERHLTVTLTDEQVEKLERTAQTGLTSESIGDVIWAGQLIWAELEAAQPRLGVVLSRIGAAGVSQPVAWCARDDLIDRLHRPLLLAHSGDDGTGFVLAGGSAHYFLPVTDPGRPRTMKRRAGTATPAVRRLDLRRADGEHPANAPGDAVATEIVVALSEPSETADAVRELQATARASSTSPTRALFSFGAEQVGADLVGEVLDIIPFLSVAADSLATPEMLNLVEEALCDHGDRLAIPCIVSAVRAASVQRAVDDDDVTACLSALTWSTWSWVGRPLFALYYREVLPAAYPHLMDLRTVAKTDWYFNRSKDIAPVYQADELARGENDAHFHLYLSGAGGTGKSCFLRYIYDQVVDDHARLAVWYRVDAPNSSWEEVARRVREETEAAIRIRFPVTGDQLLPPHGGKLGKFLERTVELLRASGERIEELVVFIDQLERTFESGDEPNFARLERISYNFIDLLKDVQVGEGVRVFVASRKQYLPDFLGSSRKATDSGLEFNVLQTISDRSERVAFVDRVLDWCRAQRLVDRNVTISEDVAAHLVEQVDGHPLNTMLALIQLLSQHLVAEVTMEQLARYAPWERLFALDLQAAALDALDWYFVLAMAHARTEIVRFEEVWWRLRMVDPRLTRRVEDLAPQGLVERLWMLGFLGRTIHARPHGADPARYVEFFHANLRDFLLRDVMTHGGSDLDLHGRRGETPPAWRALERLAVYARDWEQTQQLLPFDDVRVLMEHREDVIDAPQAPGESRQLPFHLLFLRDAEAARERLSLAAMECFVFSALVHDDSGRWAFAALFPDVADRAERCRTWLRRCSAAHRPAVLRYLIELEAGAGRDLLIELVLDEANPDGEDMALALAAILAEPLYAARYRNEFTAALLERALREVDAVERLPSRVAAFTASACQADWNSLLQLLVYCTSRLDASDDTSVKRLAPDLSVGSFAEDWLQLAPAGVAYRGLTDNSSVAAAAPLAISFGSAIAAAVDEARIAAWSDELRKRIGIPLPELATFSGETEADELELRIQGSRISTNLFRPDRVCVSKRQWEDVEGSAAADAIPAYDHGLDEDVLWVLPGAVNESSLSLIARDFEKTVLDWLEAHCRRSFDVLFDIEVVIGLLRELSSTRGRIRLGGLSLPQLRQVIVDLVEEGVPIGSRRDAIFDEISQLAPRLKDPDLVTAKLREHLRTDICRTVSDGSWQVATVLLDEELERQLADRVKLQGDRRVLRLTAAEGTSLAASVRRQIAIATEGGRALPVVVTLPELRTSFARLVRRFDPRLRVLSFTELDPDLIPLPAGVINVPDLFSSPR